MSNQALDKELFDAVGSHDRDAIVHLIQLGANPFVPIGPVELYMHRDSWSVRLWEGCAAAKVVQFPEIMELVLPDSMDGWPVVTRATDVWGVVSKSGQEVDLGHWAVELGSLDCLRILIKRLDMHHQKSKDSLNQLTLSCLRGCSYMDARDDVLQALALCMAARPQLDRIWSHWRQAKLPSHNANHELIYMPMTFALAELSGRKNMSRLHCGDALQAMAWALMHDEAVRDGHRTLGDSNEDTLLHMAIGSGNMNVLRVALDMGCDTQVKNADGLTALDFAYELHKFDFAALIESSLGSNAINDVLRDAKRRMYECRVH